MFQKGEVMSATKFGWRVEAKIRYYQRFAGRQGLVWNLPSSLSRILLVSDCYYCGEVWKNPVAGGIDRLDPGFGFTPENCVGCCLRCNDMKAGVSEQEFLDTCKNIASRHTKLDT